MRYERKYRIDHLAQAVVEQVIRLHPAGFRRLYPDRWINNIYFDTPDLITFQQNVVGAPHRAKYRLRWYGDDDRRATRPQFEIKAKHNELGSKVQFPFSPFSLDRLEAASSELNRKAPTFALLRPALMNRYRRSYFGSPDGRFRLTLDSRLSFRAVPHRSQAQRVRAIQDPAIIVELKYDHADDGAADRITQFLPFRASKSSKYVTGINLTMG